MAEPAVNKNNLELISLRCPSCGATVNVEGQEGSCIYCGNALAKISNKQDELSGTKNQESSSEPSIKTPTSTEAFIEHYYEDYDWYSFGQTSSFLIPRIDTLINNLQVAVADDFKVWEISFNSLYYKSIKKIAVLNEIFNQIKDLYGEDKSEAHGNFSLYFNVAKKTIEQKDDVLKLLTKYVTRADKYGLDKILVVKMSNQIKEIEKLFASFVLHDNLNSYEEIKQLIGKLEKAYIQEKALENIDVEHYYERALSHIEKDEIVEALSLLHEIKAYRDAEELINECNELFTMPEVLKHRNHLFYTPNILNEFHFYIINPAINKVEKEVLTDCAELLANQGSNIYYLTKIGHLHLFDIKTNKITKIDQKNRFKYFGFLDRKIFLIDGAFSDVPVEKNKKTAKKQKQQPVNSPEVNVKNNLYILNLIDGKLEKTSEDISDVLFKKSLSVVGFIKNELIYTRKSPNNFNYDLHAQDFMRSGSERLIERNIYRVLKVINDNIYYLVGSARNHTLISIKVDGTGRFELPLFVKNVLFERFGWLYFQVGDDYNTALYKSRLDGTEIKRIIVGIDEFIKFDEEYIYYLYQNKLYRVQQNGLNNTLLHEYVDSVVSISQNEIYLISKDGDVIKSLYLISPHSNIGMQKIAYNIVSAKKSKDEEIYFVIKNINEQANTALAQTKSKNTPPAVVIPQDIQSLFKYDMITKEIIFISELIKKPKKSKKWIVVLAIIIFLIVAIVVGYKIAKPYF